MKTKYIKCACSSELISLEKWEDDNQIYLSIWERGYQNNNKLTFFERIRWCWEILRNGRAFGDQIVLDNDNIDDIVEALNELKNYD